MSAVILLAFQIHDVTGVTAAYFALALINGGWLVILVALVLVVQVGIDIGARMRNQAVVEVAVSH